MFTTMGYGVYFFFASLMLCSIVFVYFLIPETKSVPLEAMDRLFDVKPVRKANKTILSELRHQDEEFRRNASDAGIDAAARNEKQKEMADHVEHV